MRILALFALLLVAVPAHADTVYNFVGREFTSVSGAYTTSDRIRGSFTMADGFTPEGFGCTEPFACTPPGSIAHVVTWVFSDEHQTFTPENTTSAEIRWTPGTVLGAAVRWVVSFGNALGSLLTANFGDQADTVRSEAGTAGNHSLCCAGDVTHAPVWTVQAVSVPERAILPKLPRLLKVGPGLGLEAAVTRRLQVATAWAAAALLGARRDGLFIDMPRVRLEVAEACSGLQTLLVMLLVAGLLAAVARYPGTQVPRKLVFYLSIFLAAALLALEANALRVAGIAVTLEHLGAISALGKDWIQYGTTGLALAQLVGLGRLVAR